MVDLPIVRLYPSSDQATRALDSLRRWGLERDRIVVIPPATGENAAPPSATAPSRAEAPRGGDDSLAEALRRAWIPTRQAGRYAEAIRRGATLVSVRAPFGTGGIVEDRLDAALEIEPETTTAAGSAGDTGSAPFARSTPYPASVSYGRPSPYGSSTPYDGPLPFPSSGEPSLPSDVADPLSRALGLPTLSRRGRTTSEVLGLPTLANPDHFTFGSPRLSRDPAPFSRLFGLPVLSRRGRTLGEALGLPEIIRSDRYAFGTPRLFDSPAPLSSLLHLPVLLRSRHAPDIDRSPGTGSGRSGPYRDGPRHPSGRSPASGTPVTTRPRSEDAARVD